MIFWDVDTQIDFLLPSGRLYVSGSEKIVANLHELTVCAAAYGVAIVSSACAHLPGDPEMQTYGPHCMAGTPGQQKLPETLLPSRFVVPNRRFELPDLKSFQQVIIEKQAFDVFTNPNAERAVRQFGSGFRVLMYGVATDICVACAANALLDRGHHVELVGDAIAALDEKKAGSFRPIIYKPRRKAGENPNHSSRSQSSVRRLPQIPKLDKLADASELRWTSVRVDNLSVVLSGTSGSKS